MPRSERVVAIFDADGRRLNAGLDRMEKRVGGFKRTLSTAFKGLKSVAGFGGLGALVGGGFAFGQVAGDVLDFETGLARLGIASRGAFGDLSGLREEIGRISEETGVSRTKLLEAAQSYVALTGDAAGAGRQLQMFARVQVATGSAMGDIAASAAAMSQNLGIGADEMEKAFSILIAGGKAGAIELKDLAGLLAGLTPLAARFAGGSGIHGLVDLSAALQLTRQGFGSAEQAATGLEALMGAIVQNSKKLEKAGIKVFTKDPRTGVKTMRGLMEIVNGIANSKLAKDPTLLVQALGRKEAEQAYLQLVKNRRAWGDLAESTLKARDVGEDYEAFQKTAAAKIHKSFEALKLSIAETFTPERIDRFARALEHIVDKADRFIAFIERIRKGMEITPEERTEGEKRALKAWEGVSEGELEYRAATGDQLAAQVLAIKRRERYAKERFEEQVEGGEALTVPQPGAFDTEEEARKQEEAREAGVIVYQPEHPEVRRRAPIEAVEVDVRVGLDRDGNFNVKHSVDNHRSLRQ